jgi:glyoxylase-like metal-dependent hydrolase (beta-lactamase superfamily II)
MKILMLKKNPNQYSCNVYFVRGTWNALSDINTLIDVGIDDYILNEIDTLSTGVGKKRVEQVILTHEHFDHASGLKYIRKIYNPPVIAYANIDGGNIAALDGMHVKIGDCDAEILHTPGHSHDSICIYCETEKTLFSGDTPLFIRSSGGTYSHQFMNIIEKLSKLKIESIYSGHDEPILSNINIIFKETLRNIRKSKIVD